MLPAPGTSSLRLERITVGTPVCSYHARTRCCRKTSIRGSALSRPAGAAQVQHAGRRSPTIRTELPCLTAVQNRVHQQDTLLPSRAQPWPALSWPQGLMGYAATIALAASLLAALPAAASTSDLAALTIPGIVGDNPLREGFVSGFLLIFFSEIGDKTFFIALLLSLRQPKSLVFTGTFGALAIMTVISVLLGQVLHQVDELVPQASSGVRLPYDDLLAAALLVYFGIKTLQDAKDAGESAAEEKEEAQEVVDELKASGDAMKMVLSTFALVFAAEWGDKSFLATIALAAASSPLGVTAGAVAGHGVATGIAVAGGGFLSKYFSERVLQTIGGSLFLVFAASTLLDIFVEMKQ